MIRSTATSSFHDASSRCRSRERCLRRRERDRRNCVLRAERGAVESEADATHLGTHNGVKVAPDLADPRETRRQARYAEGSLAYRRNRR
jgi:hypothetical protein